MIGGFAFLPLPNTRMGQGHSLFPRGKAPPPAASVHNSCLLSCLFLSAKNRIDFALSPALNLKVKGRCSFLPHAESSQS